MVDKLKKPIWYQYGFVINSPQTCQILQKECTLPAHRVRLRPSKSGNINKRELK